MTSLRKILRLLGVVMVLMLWVAMGNAVAGSHLSQGAGELDMQLNEAAAISLDDCCFMCSETCMFDYEDLYAFMDEPECGLESEMVLCPDCPCSAPAKWLADSYPESPDNPGGANAVSVALDKLGTSHRKIDCSGLVAACYPNLKLPASSAAQEKFSAKTMLLVEGIENARMGDLIFFKSDESENNRVNHVGLVLGVDSDGKLVFVHSSNSKGVSLADTSQMGGYGRSTWGQLIKSIYRPRAEEP